MSEKMTGYPSIDKPWLKYYGEESREKSLKFPKDKILWDIIEEKLIEHKEVTAIEYMGKTISRPQLITQVYEWARILKALGVNEDEIVPIYGPFFPDIFSITFALNVIGAVPYFLKLAISKDALEEETKEAKIAIVYDGMLNNVREVLEQDRFEKVVLISVTDGMPGCKKGIVNFLGLLKPSEKLSDKYIKVSEAKKYAKFFDGDVRAEFVSDRRAFITSSSGTTGGVVKGTVATNETAIAQIYQAVHSEINFIKGKKCLTNLPPTASTSLNCLCFLPLYFGMTIINEPRLDINKYYNQIKSYKPSVALMTGSFWEYYFRQLEIDIKKGKKPDLSEADMWIIGGEGTTPKYVNLWNSLMKECGAPYPIYCGYGASEVFAVATVESRNSFAEKRSEDSALINLGIPFVGFDVKVVDSEEKELTYNERGELYIKSPTIMKEYYGKKELTEKTIVNGWYKTGDIVEIDSHGYLYFWGRATNVVDFNNKKIYIFDLEYLIKHQEHVLDAVVVVPDAEDISFAVHIVFDAYVSECDKKTVLQKIDEEIYHEFGVVISGYMEHTNALPCSPTTAKKDRGMLKQIKTGYVKLEKGEFEQISL